VYGLFATWLQTDLKIAAAVVGTPILLSNLATFFACWIWGPTADRIGRRGTLIVQALTGCMVAPVYLLTGDLTVILAGFVVQGFFGGSVPLLAPAYMTERFPTEVRTSASAFCYHFGLVFGGSVPPIISYFAIEHHMGFALPMLIGTITGAVTMVCALLLSPETKGKVFVSDLMSHSAEVPVVSPAS
jgi:SHS family lactate transporter-like MFS transporter